MGADWLGDYVKLSKFTKTIFTHNDVTSAWDKSCDPGANWSKLEHMGTSKGESYHLQTEKHPLNWPMTFNAPFLLTARTEILVKITYLGKDLFEMNLKKLFSIFCYIKLLCWTLIFISFIPHHVIDKIH